MALTPLAQMMAPNALQGTVLNPPAAQPGQTNAPGSPYTIPSLYPGQPSSPGYTSPMTGVPSLGADASQLLSGNQLDTSGLNEFQSQAESQGPSQWAQQAEGQQNYLAMQAKDQGAATTAGQTATAQAALAAKGGLSGGAAERLAQGGANNYLNMTQGINNTETGNNMQIGMNDQQNKLSMLGQLPGMQLGAANFGLNQAQTQLGADTNDASNIYNANNSLNNFNMNAYGQAMGGFGAQQEALGQASAGKSL